MIITNIVEKRKKTGTRGDDPLQFLIDEGDSMSKIVEVILHFIIASTANAQKANAGNSSLSDPFLPAF